MDKLKNILLDISDRIKVDSIKFPQFSLDSKGTQLLIFVLAIIVLSWLINFLLFRSVFGSKYRLFVAPGVVLHEWSHAFFCLITGAKIKKIALFEKEGGYVEHEKSKLPVFGQILISFAPFMFGSVAIYFLAKLLGFSSMPFSFELSSQPYSIWNSIMPSLANYDYMKWQNWAVLYLVLSIAVTMTPSRKDFENVILSVIFVILAALAVYQFVPYNFSAMIMPDRLLALLTTTVFLLILSLGFSIVVYVLSRIVSRK